MSIKKNALLRIRNYSVGIFAQIFTIFFLTTQLDILQFGVWGVANSFIFVLSTIFQLSYCEDIEKYFPNLNNDLRQKTLVKYLKTVVLCLPFIVAILVLINFTNYFRVLELSNLYYLFLLISFHAIIESLLAIFDSYYLSKNFSRYYDSADLYIYKIPRLAIFVVLVIQGYSVYYLLFSSLILRILLLVQLILKEFKTFNTFLKLLLSVEIFKNNFINIKYTFQAFVNNILYFSFLNLLFLISINNLDSLDIAHFSLSILIINSLRPIFNSLPSILSPIISKESFMNKNPIHLINASNKVNLLFISISLTASIYIIENKLLINFFLKDYYVGIYKLIFLSIFASTLRSTYFNKYLKLLFKGLESKLLKFNLVLSLILLATFAIPYEFYKLNFLYFYMFYELNLYFYINHLYNSEKSLFKEIFQDLNFSYIFILLICIFYMLNIYIIELLFLSLLIIFFDFLKTFKIFFQKKINLNNIWESLK